MWTLLKKRRAQRISAHTALLGYVSAVTHSQTHSYTGGADHPERWHLLIRSGNHSHMQRHWHTRTLCWITPMPPELHAFTAEPQMALKIMQLENINKKCCATNCLFVVLKLAKATFKIDGSYYSLTHFYSRSKLHTRVLSCCLQDSSSDLVESLIMTMQHYCALMPTAECYAFIQVSWE